MRKALHISNYALISQIDIDLCTGLNIVTGETGAGKSVMLGALGLLLGGRADMRVVRDSERKSVIEAVATIGDVPGIDAVFEENNLDRVTDGVCILRRELLPGGRSRAFINDTPVTLQVLKAVALRLIDIHSQHENLLLADTDYQLSIIDILADNADERALYSVAYASYRRALKAFTDMRELLRRSAADAQYLQFQLNQLDEMKLQHGEQEQLERDRELLANATAIKQHLRSALGPMAEDNINAIGVLAEAAMHCRALGDMIEDGEEDGSDDMTEDEKGEVSDDTTEDEKANASNDKKDNDKETTESPKTGDTANVWGYLICAGASIIVILEITFRKRLLR